MYSIIDKRIIAFIHEHHVLTLATCVNGIPYCAHLFYVYLDAENVFVVTSSASTRHIGEALHSHTVAGAVALETATVGLIRGLQWQGALLLPDKDLKRKARRAYLRRFPFAVLKGSPLWALRPTFFKYTDNRLGFGKKIIITLPSNENQPL
ncbi:MAG: pyridoxamine 5'-phosphate oxidase family protein [Prevotellaceae bacterium]|jgi:uncharacterized protein YhbP (UPF0306 family)|nr:pyridoxamine 5'-phosphate oxidase family protein [Prevotellaceae bacterium]